MVVHPGAKISEIHLVGFSLAVEQDVYLILAGKIYHKLHRRYAAHSSPALPQHWPPNLRDSREVFGDSNRKSPLCDRCRLFSLAELRDGWQYGPGASICVSLFRHLGGNS